MRIFLSYASEDRDLAEQVSLALTAEGHEVFFDKNSLPPAGDFRSRIRDAVDQSDCMVFLITAQSVARGSFALTELEHAKRKWRHPKDHVLPVRIGDVPWESIPQYLKAVTVLEPSGDVADPTVVAAAEMASRFKEPRKPWWQKKITFAVSVSVTVGLLVIGIVVLPDALRTPSQPPQGAVPVSSCPGALPVTPSKETGEADNRSARESNGTADIVVFRSKNYASKYLQHVGDIGLVEDVISDKDRMNATWLLTHGLADEQGSSLESCSSPGSFLRSLGFELRIDKREDSQDYRIDATFRLVPGLADPKGVSFQSSRHPDRFVRHYNFRLRLDPREDSAGFRDDATFYREPLSGR